MANKIPVGGTIAHAYRFTFGNIVNNFGAIWLPALILYALSYFLFSPYTAEMLKLAPGDLSGVRHFLPIIGFSAIFMVILLSCQIASLTKEALGLRTGNVFLQFPFGAAWWRLLVTYILFVLAVIAIYVAVLILAVVGGFLLGLVASHLSKPTGLLLVGLSGLVAAVAMFCATIYIVVRLSFLIAPVAVAEKRITLIRGWTLTRGNFWRIFVILLSVLVPMLIAEFAYMYAVFGWEVFPQSGMQMNPVAIAQWQQHQRELVLTSTAKMQHYWYVTYPIGLLVALIMYGLLAGISAFAYRALVPASAAEAPT